MWNGLLNLLAPLVQWEARLYTIIRNFFDSSLSREKRFGKLLVLGFLLSLFDVAYNFIKIGVTQTGNLLRGLAGDSGLLSGGNILSWASQSLSPVVDHATQIFPEFWRWLGYWIGFDWLVWLFVCSAVFAFCGWVVGLLVKAVAAILHLCFQFS